MGTGWKTCPRMDAQLGRPLHDVQLFDVDGKPLVEPAT